VGVMTQNNENIQASGLDSKFMKVTMMIVSVLLIFAGPTYVPYLMSDILHVNYGASIAVGLVLLLAGLGLLVFLIRKKVVE
jgi:hypothetical protein